MHIYFLTVASTLLASWSTAATAAIVPAHSRGNSSWPYHTFRTVGFTPPYLQITDDSPRHYPGYLFIAPDGDTFQRGPVIMNLTDGELIWNGPNIHAFNFGVQQFLGEDVLALWSGDVLHGGSERGNGRVYLLDNSYTVVTGADLPGRFVSRTTGASYDSNIDLYEVHLTSKGTIIVTASNVTQTDLSSVGGPKDGWIVNCLIREIDSSNNDLITFEWSSLDHLDQLPLKDSLYPLGSDGFDGTKQESAWGYFHLNSVSPFQDGYLISSRNFCSAIAIGADGRVKWTLQGKTGGDFKLANGTHFCFQHDVRTAPVRPESGSRFNLHMYDNHNIPGKPWQYPSSGLALYVDPTSMSVALKQRYGAPAPMYSTSEGNMEPIYGHWFIGHGMLPIAQEFNAYGRNVTTIQYGPANSFPDGSSYIPPGSPRTFSYRAFRQEWTGCPLELPSVVAEIDGNGTTVYVSWNGATEVHGWRIYGGWSSEDLQFIMSAGKSGFETVVHIKRVNYVRVVPVFKPMGLVSASESSYACNYTDDAASNVVELVA